MSHFISELLTFVFYLYVAFVSVETLQIWICKTFEPKENRINPIKTFFYIFWAFPLYRLFYNSNDKQEVIDRTNDSYDKFIITLTKVTNG
jgi:hypothetical protein